MPEENGLNDGERSYRLVILGNESARTVPLVGQRWTLGRSASCSVILRDASVSRRHVLIERDGATFRFRDLGGANPTRLLGRVVTSGELPLGQPLTVGLTQVSIEERARPSAVEVGDLETITVSREVIDEESPDPDPADAESEREAIALKVLGNLEWAVADVGDLFDAAEPLLAVALQLTGRSRGWIARLPTQTSVETLAVIPADDVSYVPTLPGDALRDARAIRRPHLLFTREAGAERERLVIPMGSAPGGLLVVEGDRDGAPRGQRLLRIAALVGRFVWQRCKEVAERAQLRDELARRTYRSSDEHNALSASARLQETRERVRALAASGAGAFLVGEAGTEKQALARLLHAESPLRHGPFLVWDAEREQPSALLGDGSCAGALRSAGGGTLYLPRAPKMPASLQEQLAAALSRGDYDLRIALSARPDDGELAPALRAATDCERLEVPPLRSDARDVLVLSELFLAGLGPRPDGSPRLLSERAKRTLTSYAWPENVRELRLCIEAAAARAGDRPIAPRDLPVRTAEPGAPSSAAIPTLEQIERQHIEEVMRRTGGVRTRAAQALGIATSTLYEKLKRYRIER